MTTAIKSARKFNNLGSLITYSPVEGVEFALGYLIDANSHGIYDAELGRIDDITSEQAAIHNKLLDQAMIEGLDNNCGVGEGATFYAMEDDNGRDCVKTFLGTEIADAAHTTVAGRKINFFRRGKTFEGTISGDKWQESVFFRRTI